MGIFDFFKNPRKSITTVALVAALLPSIRAGAISDSTVKSFAKLHDKKIGALAEFKQILKLRTSLANEGKSKADIDKATDLEIDKLKAKGLDFKDIDFNKETDACIARLVEDVNKDIKAGNFDRSIEALSGLRSSLTNDWSEADKKLQGAIDTLIAKLKLEKAKAAKKKR